MPSNSGKTSKRGRGKAVPASSSYDEWLISRLKDPSEAAAYIEAAIAEEDQAALMIALRQVAQAKGGVAAIARKAKLTREATYKMLSRSGSPELRSLNALLRATGLRLAVRPIGRKAV
jgi:probable addiction module antidote protein